MTQFIADDGAVLAYDVAGDGKPLVFIHGWDANRRYFKDQVARFSRDHKVIALDLRGHGESDRSERAARGLTLERCARDVKALLAHLDLDGAVLVGWSMGVSVILDYVRQWGCEGLSGLCLIDMTPKLLVGPDWNLAAIGNYDEAATLKFLGAIARDWEDTSQKFLPFMFAKSTPTKPELLAWVGSQIRDNAPHCLIPLWISMALADYRPVLGKIDVPTLLAFAGDGFFYGERHARYMNEHIAGSTLAMFEGCGHALHMENAEAFDRALEGLLDQIERH